MTNLIAAQRAYESSARLMTTIDSMLDTLINRTGLTT
jgi:flagellar hook-associated protein 1 FlgK